MSDTTGGAAGGTGTQGGAGASTPAAGAASSSGASSGGTQTWRDTLPDDLKNDPAVVNMPDVPTLVKSYKHAQSLVGKKGVFPPGEKATDEDYARFAREAGQPEYEKFTLNAPEGVAKEFTEHFRKMAHAAGALPFTAQKIYDGLIQMNKDQTAAQKAHVEKTVKEEKEALLKEWGDGADKMFRLRDSAIKDVGGGELLQFMKASGLIEDVRLTKAFARMGQILGEGTLRGDAEGGLGKTPMELKTSIDKIFLDPDYGSSTPRGRQLALQMEELQRRANPA